ncbi:unnamed protein product [Cylindrotheca closterium]|uniref:Uncharacterized protein n=1 Tax=Cylindrotheca closterium TaxID=2856 RepID=A0AAD2FNU4_9STRA|nr:unnamed protein product [Cylindrotheca closterium]
MVCKGKQWALFSLIAILYESEVSCFPAMVRHRRAIQKHPISFQALSMSGLFGEVQETQRRKDISDTLEWQIYVDQSKASLDRGAVATLDAFCGLATERVQIIPAILPKSKHRSPWVRCMSTKIGSTNIDVGNVDSVDKVYRILSKHLKVENVSKATCNCLRWKYEGNSYLEQGNLDLAIDAYNQALSNKPSTSMMGKQDGVILLLRASAFLKRAQAKKRKLTKITQDWVVPDVQEQQELFLASCNGGLGLANSVLRQIEIDGMKQKQTMQQIQYHHGLYQYALLRAAKDALRGTEILPKYPTSFLRAAEVLSELWNLGESRRYLERALALDATLEKSVTKLLERLERRQQILDKARATQEWPDDSLRLALDIAA